MLVKIIGKYLSNISSHIIKSKVKTYNIAEIVKDYCKYPKWLYLPFNIHHGWYASILPRIKDLSPKTYPIMLVWNKRQEYEWKKHSKLAVCSIGSPFIHYRRKKNIKQKDWAKGTVAFPSHSSRNTTVQYDINKYFNILQTLPESYKPITICLHHYDFTNKIKEQYEKLGIKVVSAGHVHSSSFVDNFYDILSEHKYATSNAIGTYVLYSIEMGIPFFLYGEKEKINRLIRKGNDGGSLESMRLLAEKLFSYSENELAYSQGVIITKEQKDFVLSESGVEDCIKPEELRKLLLKAFFLKTIPLAIGRLITLPIYVIKKVIL